MALARRNTALSALRRRRCRFIENVREELDNPGEFFFDKGTSELFLYYNGTGAPPASSTFVVPTKKVLVNQTGTRWNPVKHVKLADTTYTATAFTYMEPHGVPSAGDWALDRTGSVFLEGTEGASIEGCTFERLDSNAVMISGYNRNATVTKSDFAFIGGNAVASWGYTNVSRHCPGVCCVLIPPLLAGVALRSCAAGDGQHGLPILPPEHRVPRRRRGRHRR